MRRYWDESLVSFNGRFDRVDRGNILPRPKRRIPIWIGGLQRARPTAVAAPWVTDSYLRVPITLLAGSASSIISRKPDVPQKVSAAI